MMSHLTKGDLLECKLISGSQHKIANPHNKTYNNNLWSRFSNSSSNKCNLSKLRERNVQLI